MPHDQLGKELQVGDEVLIRARVLALHASPNLCNVDVELVHRQQLDESGAPHPDPTRLQCLNTKQLEFVGRAAVAGADSTRAVEAPAAAVPMTTDAPPATGNTDVDDIQLFDPDRSPPPTMRGG